MYRSILDRFAVAGMRYRGWMRIPIKIWPNIVTMSLSCIVRENL